MTTNAKASLAIIAGCLAGFATMGLHPTGHQIAADMAAGGHGALNSAVHSLALAGQALLLVGLLALTLQFKSERALGVAAYIVFAWASAAVMIAATMSGFVATELIGSRVGEQGSALDAINAALHYTGTLNQAFSKIYIAFSSTAILLWSAAILRERGFPRNLAVFGLVIGVTFILGVLSGHLRPGIHGFGSVVLGEGIWFIWAAVALRRMPY